MKLKSIKAKPLCWMTKESLQTLKSGGNDSRGTVPVHHKRTNLSSIPLFTEDELNQACIQAYTFGVINAERAIK